MREQAFREYLISRGVSIQEIDSQIKIIRKIESDLRQKVPSWSLDDLNAVGIQEVFNTLMDQGENTVENLQTMARYAKAVKNDLMFVSVFEMLDGYEVMERLHKKVADFAGEDLRDMIFEDLPLPPLGLSRKGKAQYTYRIMHRMETIFEERTCREILRDSLRFLPDEYYQNDKKDYFDKCKGDMDQFLRLKRDKFVNTLIDHQSNGELFFGQEITADVIAFVKANPEMGCGVRVGDIVYETKIPYNTKAYLEETNPVVKRYHYCHCPWAKESLRKSTFKVSPIFCQCSAGFHKKRYEIIFDQPILAKVEKSVLAGDLICRMAIHLPIDG